MEPPLASPSFWRRKDEEEGEEEERKKEIIPPLRISEFATALQYATFLNRFLLVLS